MGLQGHSDPEGRDLTVDAMNAVAKRLTRRYPADVTAVRYRERMHEVDGFMVWTKPVTVGGDTEWWGPVLYFPVRRRLRIGRWAGTWREVEPVAAAASRVGRAGRTDSN